MYMVYPVDTQEFESSEGSLSATNPRTYNVEETIPVPAQAHLYLHT